MMEIEMTWREMEDLKDLCKTRRWDWPAVFSANFHGQIWAFSTYGYTKTRKRRYVTGDSPIIDAIVVHYLTERLPGGRVFLDEEGAFWKDQQLQLHQFVRFDYID
jgi:hypothetical protein